MYSDIEGGHRHWTQGMLFDNVVENGSGNVRLSKQGSAVTRQSAPTVYDMNASIYVWQVESLRATKKTILNNSAVYVMPKERSVDIDDAVDFMVAEMLMSKRP